MLVEIIKNILENEKLIEKLINLDSMVEVYEFCKENGYTEDYETFKKETEKILKNSKLSENDLANIAGGKSQRINKAIAGTLAALSITSASGITPSTFATEGNKSNFPMKSIILNKIKENPYITAGFSIATATIGSTAIGVLVAKYLKEQKQKISHNNEFDKNINNKLDNNTENETKDDETKEENIVEYKNYTVNKTKKIVTITGDISKDDNRNLVNEYFTEEKKYSLTIEKGAEISGDTFSGAHIENLTIEKNVNINKDAFCYANITNLTIKNGAEITWNAFWNANITNLTIEKGAEISGDTFSGAHIENLTIEKGAKIESNAFFYANITEEVTINETNPEKLKEIATAFLKANFVFEKVKINKENYVEWLKKNAPKFENVEVNDNTITVKQNVSDTDMKKLKKLYLIKDNKYSLTIENGAKIESNAFKEAHIENLTIENGAEITWYAFWNANITNLTIKNGAKIESNAFKEAHIENLTIENGAKIESNAFCCANITEEVTINETNPEKLKEIATAFLKANFVFEKVKINKENYVEWLKKNAPKFENVEVNDNTITVKQNVSDTDMKKLKKLYLIKDNKYSLTIENGAEISGDTFSGAHIENFTIEKNVNINKDAFCYANITNLTIENGAKIESNAFFDANITNLTIKNGAEIESNTFCYANITNLTIENGAKIESNTFCYANITNLTIKENVNINEDAFRNANITEEVTIKETNPEKLQTIKEALL